MYNFFNHNFINLKVKSKLKIYKFKFILKIRILLRKLQIKIKQWLMNTKMMPPIKENTGVINYMMINRIKYL